VKLPKKLQTLIPVGILMILSVAPLSAQNVLPDPQDDACWQSLSALHACQLEQYNRAMDQAERCTSYPEYQCMPVPEQSDANAPTVRGMSIRGDKTAASEKSTPVSETAVRSVSAQTGGF